MNRDNYRPLVTTGHDLDAAAGIVTALLLAGFCWLLFAWMVWQ